MRRVLTLLFLFAAPLIHGGCGGGANSGNSDAPVLVSAHESGWKFTHDSEATKDLFTCQVCHGADFRGSGPVPSCYVCHLGGPPFFLHPPPMEPVIVGVAAEKIWSHPANHGFYAKRDIQSCQMCHGQPGGPGSNPPFDVSLRSLTKGCESSGCHNNRTAHPAKNPNPLNPLDPARQDQRHWYNETVVFQVPVAGGQQIKTYLVSHYNAGNVSGACTLCHGANLQGGVGPACTLCHVLDPRQYPQRCVSCHGPLPGEGGQPMATGDFLASVGRTEPLDSRFRSELIAGIQGDPVYKKAVYLPMSTVAQLSRRSLHLHHDALPCGERQTSDDCRKCHGDDASLVVRHHDLMYPPPRGKLLGCMDCHILVTGSTGAFDFLYIRDCRSCHIENFAQPCQ